MTGENIASLHLQSWHINLIYKFKDRRSAAEVPVAVCHHRYRTLQQFKQFILYTITAVDTSAAERREFYKFLQF